MKNGCRYGTESTNYGWRTYKLTAAGGSGNRQLRMARSRIYGRKNRQQQIERFEQPRISKKYAAVYANIWDKSLMRRADLNKIKKCQC